MGRKGIVLVCKTLGSRFAFRPFQVFAHVVTRAYALAIDVTLTGFDYGNAVQLKHAYRCGN
jgi:hypothetical protein